MQKRQALLLNREQVMRKVQRIAYQIYEDNFEEDEIVFAGINGSGYILAQMLRDFFTTINHKKVDLQEIIIDKKDPKRDDIKMNPTSLILKDRSVVLVDDVLYTGKTLMYSLIPLIEGGAKKIQIAVVVNRSQRNFPIFPNYVGYQMSTTLNEYIEVILDDSDEFGVYIS